MEHEPHTHAEPWAQRIHAIGKANSVESTVMIGQLLRAAKTALTSQEFLRLVSELLPFRKTTSYQLMRVAQHPVLGNLRYAAQLPPGWSVLDHLTMVPPDLLEAAIADGSITTKTTTTIALRLVRDLAQAPPKPKKPTIDRSPAAKAARLALIRELAATGATSDQIAARINTSPAGCRKMMKHAGITCPGDRVERGKHKIRRTDLLDSLAHTPESIGDAINLIDVADIPLDRLPSVIDLVTVARRDTHHTFTLFLVQLMREKSRKERHAEKVAAESSFV